MTEIDPPSRPPRCPTRSRWGAAVVALLALGPVGGCGTAGSGPSEAPDVLGTPTTERPGPTDGSAAPEAPTSTTPPPTSSSVPVAARWVGRVWTAGADDPQSVEVDGQPTGLRSVSGLCVSSDCTRSTDLLATSAASSGAPDPGDYLLFANRLIERRADGVPVWEVTDAVGVVLADGESPIVCSPVDDPVVQVQGIVSGALPEGGTVTPGRVWTVDDAGRLQTLDPGGYRCEVGQD